MFSADAKKVQTLLMSTRSDKWATSNIRLDQKPWTHLIRFPKSADVKFWPHATFIETTQLDVTCTREYIIYIVINYIHIYMLYIVINYIQIYISLYILHKTRPSILLNIYIYQPIPASNVPQHLRRVSSQCVRCGLGPSECRCHLSSSEKVLHGFTWSCVFMS